MVNTLGKFRYLRPTLRSQILNISAPLPPSSFPRSISSPFSNLPLLHNHVLSTPLFIITTACVIRLSHHCLIRNPLEEDTPTTGPLLPQRPRFRRNTAASSILLGPSSDLIGPSDLFPVFLIVSARLTSVPRCAALGAHENISCEWVYSATKHIMSALHS